ncbi:hypothetical protein AAF712_003870 [Marasmius tenuissimus]|uniref:Uncharacterized protein n=1 Tax=Marasmius tenuissimus TaxID=585030 RepID=A0ABR3A5G1_9AGAR
MYLPPDSGQLVLNFSKAKSSQKKPGRPRGPQKSLTELMTLRKANAALEETNVRLKEQLEAQIANKIDVQAKLDAEITRMMGLEQECEALRQEVYRWRHLQQGLEDRLRGRGTCREFIDPRIDKLEDLRRDNERMKGELEKFRRSQVELEEKAAAARADLKRSRDEQIKVHAESIDQRSREMAEKEEIVVRLEHCKREGEATKARLEAERTASGTRHQPEEICKALHDADVKGRSESARWNEEEKAPQSVIKVEEVTIPSLQQEASSKTLNRDPEPSKVSRRGSEASLGCASTTIWVSESNRGISLGKRKRASSRSPICKDDISVHIVVDSEVTSVDETSKGRQTFPSPLFTQPKIKLQSKAELRTQLGILPVHVRKDITTTTRRKTRSAHKLEPVSPPASPGLCKAPESLTDGDGGSKSKSGGADEGGLGFL